MKALLFDLDGVLVDVTRSYHRTIAETLRRFGAGEIDDTGIQAYKARGGLNDDWDLTQAVLRERGVSVPREKVVEAFQEIYLGKRFDGLILNEEWLIRSDVLAGLSESHDLGIVTGRPASETRFTLDRFGDGGFFRVVVTRDDLPEGRGKPDPLGIRTALARLGRTGGYYAGDNADDMRAALGAGLTPIGVVPSADETGRETAALAAAGAVRVIRDINRIKEVLP